MQALLDRKLRSVSASIALALVYACGDPARAQTSEVPVDDSTVGQDGDAGAIIVTAQRRAEPLSRVPLAVSAFGERFLAEAKTENIFDLKGYVPSFQAFAVGSGFPRFYMRGVGSNNFNIGGDLTIGVFVDDVYVGRGATAVSDLADVARVEVLRGPQGALFGRNTIGGAVAVITQQPTMKVEAQIDANYGTDNQRRLHVMGNIPLIDGALAARANITLNGRGGYITNLANGEKLGRLSSEAVRLALRYDRGGPLTVDLKADFQHDLDDGIQQRSNSIASFVTTVFGIPNTNVGYHEVISDLPGGRGGQFQERRVWGGQLRFDLETGLGTLTSISAYRGYDLEFSGDYDGTTNPALRISVNSDHTLWSQELRLASPADQRLSWVVGGLYAYEDVSEDTIYDIGFPILSIITRPPGGAFPTYPAGFLVTNDSFARGRYATFSAFGDVTWQITDQLKLLTSLRYTHDRRKFRIFTPGIPEFGGAGLFFNRVSPALDREVSFNDVSPRISLSWQANPDIMVYTTVARGYKPGGFNATSTAGDLINPFGEERLWSYEAGVRAVAFDRKLSLNLTIYQYDYDGLQINTIDDQTGIIVIRNGKVSGRGLEADAVFEPIRGLRFTGALALTDARYDRFAAVRSGALRSFAGNRAVYAPQVAYSLVGEYRRPLNGQLQGVIRAEYNHTGRQFFDPDNAPFNTERPYGLTHLRVGIAAQDERWSLAFVARNLFDVPFRIRTNAGTEAVGFPLFLDGPPQFLGVQASFRF